MQDIKKRGCDTEIDVERYFRVAKGLLCFLDLRCVGFSRMFSPQETSFTTKVSETKAAFTT